MQRGGNDTTVQGTNDNSILSKTMQRGGNDTTVQGTNDSSILSKHSMCHSGYFDDPFVKIFTGKLAPRRAPLINRGYYIRAKAVDSALSEFLKIDGNKQVVSLGAGFDSAFLRLTRKSPLLMASVLYIEVDFPEVVQRKHALLKNSTELDFNTMVSETPDGVELAFSSYRLIGADLSNLELLKQRFKQAGVDTKKMTLVLSECVMTYMEASASDALIQFCGHYFPDSLFITYEQIKPFDSFGVFMRSHFDKLNSSLKAITLYPDKCAQSERYKKHGYASVQVFTMLEFYKTLGAAEMKRINAIEYFDEFEEWHIKCDHYMMVIAKNGLCTGAFENYNRMSSDMTDSIMKTDELQPVWYCCGSERFSHASSIVSLVNLQLLLIHGGFGSNQGKHDRLSDFEVYSIGKDLTLSPLHSQTFNEKRLHHTLTTLDDGKLLMFGGRLSPAKPYTRSTCLSVSQRDSEISIEFKDSTCFADGQSDLECNETGSIGSHSLTSRWRHTATRVVVAGEECVVVVGGRSMQNKFAGEVICSVLIYKIKTGTWEELPSLPGVGRHSHAACTYGADNKLLVIGGLTENEDVLEECWLFDLEILTWSLVELPLLHVYSHTVHTYQNLLLSVGGIGKHGEQMPLQILDMNTKTRIIYTLPATINHNLMMYFNHSSELCRYGKNEQPVLIITGGGGNCFSFGTHINKYIVIFDLSKILL